MNDAKKAVSVPMGFAGIVQLVSKVTIASRALAAPKASTQPAASHAAPSVPISANQPPHEAPWDSLGWVKWVVGAVVVVVVLSLAAREDTKSTYQPPSSASASGSEATTYVPEVQAAPTSRPTEVKPPPGTDRVLTTSQLRYCIAEEMRLDGADTATDLEIETQVEAYNLMVGDFNSRCSSFKYRPGSLERVRQELEPYRAIISAEGAARIQ